MIDSYWLFQANPKYSQILQAVASRAHIYWLVSRYFQEISIDDQVLIWIAGEQSGIYAIAQVETNPQFFDEPPDIDIWTLPVRAKGKFYSPVRFTKKFLDAPLLKSDLEHDSILRHLAVIRAPHNTNFRVTCKQWQQVQKLLDKTP